MRYDDRQRRQLSKLALKVGTVATAAAALLTEGKTSAHESDLLAGILNRNDIVASVPQVTEESAERVPAPLILKPGQTDSN